MKKLFATTALAFASLVLADAYDDGSNYNSNGNSTQYQPKASTKIAPVFKPRNQKSLAYISHPSQQINYNSQAQANDYYDQNQSSQNHQEQLYYIP